MTARIGSKKFDSNLKNVQPEDYITKPICWLCKKPVEAFEVSYNHALHATIFEAFCHGKTEQVALTTEDGMTITNLKMEYAFRDNLLTPAKLTPAK